MVLLLVGILLNMQRRIERLEEQFSSGYAEIIADLHRRVEALERERR